MEIAANHVLCTTALFLVETSFLAQLLCSVLPSESFCKEALLLREFSKIRSDSNLFILQDLPGYVGQLWSRKSPLRLTSQLIQIEFLPKTSWVTLWDKFKGKKYLEPHLTKPDDKMCIICIVRSLAKLFLNWSGGKCNY